MSGVSSGDSAQLYDRQQVSQAHCCVCERKSECFSKCVFVCVLGGVIVAGLIVEVCVCVSPGGL